MRSLYNWNKVFNRVMDIKDSYLETHSFIDYNDHDENETIIHSLVNGIKDDIKRDFYKSWLSTLKITQNGHNCLLHYDLIASAEEMWSDINSINIEARSIYIDIENESIILCPMPKFFNIDEIKENEFSLILDKINKSSIFEITEKLDGSNQNATFYNNEVILCGSTACDPEKSWRIVEGYKILYSNEGYINMLKDNVNKTFIFELIHPEDAHVVAYKEGSIGLYLLCVRDNFNGNMASYKEIIDIAEKYGIPHTKMEEYTIDELLANRSKFSADELEGWVLNIDGYRVKFKTDDYLKMHKCFSNRSISKILIQEIADGTIDDFLAAVPTRVKDMSKEIIPLILDYVKNLEDEINVYWEKYKNIESQKDFALRINSEVPNEFRGYLFTKRAGKELNLLKLGCGYKKPKDLGIGNYYIKFAEINTKEEAE